MYLICTFPSKHYDIEKYPAIKKHLLSFGMEKLEQSGKTYIKNGEKIKSRKKTTNKWFETQDSIAYSDLFLEQKIIYAELVQGPKFYLDNENYFISNTGYIMNGSDLDVLIKYLNSLTVSILFKKYYSTGMGETGFRFLKQYLELLPIPKSKSEILLNAENDNEIEEIICKIYNLSDMEQNYIFSK